MARAEDGSPQSPNMAVLNELLEYFQSEASNIDHQFFLDTYTTPGSSYVSCIRFGGVPILPPLMTEKRREEMLMYKRNAVLIETRIKAKARKKLLARVQSVMSDIDERHRTQSRLDDTLSDTSKAAMTSDSEYLSAGVVVNGLASPTVEPTSEVDIPLEVSKVASSEQGSDLEESVTEVNTEVNTEVTEPAAEIVPPLDLYEDSHMNNAVADSGISSRPVTAATVQESLQDGYLDTMADLSDLSSEGRENNDFDNIEDNTFPKDGWSPRSADSGVSKGEGDFSTSVQLQDDVTPVPDTSNSSDDKTESVTVKEQIQTKSARDDSSDAQQQVSAEHLNRTDSQSQESTTITTMELPTVVEKPTGVIVKGVPAAVACLASTNSSGATASSGTTASSEEMNRTVISREEAACYQNWNNSLQEQSAAHHGEIPPKWALLSKVALAPDVDTPDSTPEDSHAHSTAEGESDETLEQTEHSSDRSKSNASRQDNETSGSTTSGRELASPGPTSTPDLSSISHVTQESETPVNIVIESATITDTQSLSQNMDSLSLQQPLTIQSTASDLYTKSTELGQYMVGSMDTIQSSLTTLPHTRTQEQAMLGEHAVVPSTDNSGNASQNSGSHQNSGSQSNSSSGKKGHVRTSSYTLVHPSPVLVAAHAKAQQSLAAAAQNTSKDNSPASVFMLTSSMEDLKLKPVQRKLHYDDDKPDFREQHSGGVTSEAESASITEAAKLRNPKKKILASESESTSESEAGKLKTRIESEKEGKQEHLHRYLQHLDAGAAPSSKENTPEHQHPVGNDKRETDDSWLQDQVDPLALVRQNPTLLQYLNEDELLQVQMHHFQQLRQQLVLQQQQQLAQMLMEQEKQQQLFQHEILEQERQLQAVRSKGPHKQKSRSGGARSRGQNNTGLSSRESSSHISASDLAAMINGSHHHAFDLSHLSSVSQTLDSIAQHQNLSHLATRPVSELASTQESQLRPVSAPTPHVHFAPEVEVANSDTSPAGRAGVYYNANFQSLPQQGLGPVDNDHHDSISDPYQSPAVLRTGSAFTRIQPRKQQQQQLKATTAEHSHPTRSKVEQKYSVLDQNIPPEVHRRFEKVSAAAKGFLTRRLLQTDRVQHLIATIRDTAQFAINFQQESPIKKGVYSLQDKNLQERVLAQLDAAMYEIHEIFFEMTTSQRMAIISQSRALERERLYKIQTLKKANEKQKRLSGATLKAMERKRKMKEAEEAVFGEARPKSAPPPHTACSARSASRHSDISGPIRRNYQFLMGRAMKPTQGHISPNKPAKDSINRATAKQKNAPKVAVKTAAGPAKVPRKTANHHHNRATNITTNTTAAPARKVAGRPSAKTTPTTKHHV